MDFGRGGYKRPCRFIRQSAGTMTIKWYRAPVGAKHYPHPHAFMSRNWDQEPWSFVGIGEQFADLKWSNGKTPVGVTGRKACGPPAWFRHGQPDDSAGPIYPRAPDGPLLACGLVPPASEARTYVPFMLDMRLRPKRDYLPVAPIPWRFNVLAKPMPLLHYASQVPLRFDMRALAVPPFQPIPSIPVRYDLRTISMGGSNLIAPFPLALDMRSNVDGPYVPVATLPFYIDFRWRYDTPGMYVVPMPVRVDLRVRAFDHTIYTAPLPLKIDLRAVSGPPILPEGQEALLDCIGQPIARRLKADIIVTSGPPVDAPAYVILDYQPGIPGYVYNGITPQGWVFVVQMICGLGGVSGLGASIVSIFANAFQPMPATSIVVGPPFRAVFDGFTAYTGSVTPGSTIRLVITTYP